MLGTGRQHLNSDEKSVSKECLLDEKLFGGDETDPECSASTFDDDINDNYNDYCEDEDREPEQEFYYNYWTYPRGPDQRELLPTSIRQWINSYKDPEREFCKVVAIYLFSFIVSLQVFSYAVSMFEIYTTIPYCGEVKGQLEFECHLWLFLFAWIACFVCTSVTLVCKYLLWLCRTQLSSKKFN